jgi:hypothetical protein
MVEFKNENGYDFPILQPVQLAILQQGDTIPWNLRDIFYFESEISYISSEGAYYQTTIAVSYPEPYIVSILGDLPINYPNITFLYNG